MTTMYGAIEAGGTKFVCAIGTDPGTVVAEARYPTDDPGTTLEAAISFFAEHAAAGLTVAAVGIASFGPVELRRDRADYGFITTTPKPGWSNTDVAGLIGRRLGVPVGFDTDVNGAALGEGRWGSAAGLDTFVYLTVGTGVGGGAVVGDRVAHGLVHAEMGHVSLVRRPADDFPGTCPFHGDCFEGMASGPAVAARWGRPGDTLTGSHLETAVEIEAFYIAEGLRNIVYTVAPQRIILGGGVPKMAGIFPAIRTALAAALAGYPGLPEHAEPNFVVPPGLGDQAGIAGGFVLAELATQE
jgi:fructokinase